MNDNTKPYRIEVAPMGDFNDFLAKLWADGWELVTWACVPAKPSKFDPGPPQPAMMMAFKRRESTASDLLKRLLPSIDEYIDGGWCLCGEPECQNEFCRLVSEARKEVGI